MGPSSGHPPDDPRLNVGTGYPQNPACQGFQPGDAQSSSPIPRGYGSSQIQNPGTNPNSLPQNAYTLPASNGCSYYQQQPYGSPDPPFEEPDQGTKFQRRMMLVLPIILVLGFCLIGIAVWLLFSIFIPNFEVASLKVSNFTATNTNLTGTWKVNLSIENWSKDLAVQFDSVSSSIFYKDALLATHTSHPFQVQQMEKHILSFNMRVEGENGKPHGGAPPGLSEELSKGTVVFEMKVGMKAVFKTSSEVSGKKFIRLHCKNMPIFFSSPGEGSLVPGLGDTCLIRVDKD